MEDADELETLVNFRDLGGIKTKEGSTLTPKRLLRSGEMVGLSKEDEEALLSEYGLKMVFDFRDDSEITMNPDVVLNGVVYTHIDVMKDVRLNQESMENLYKMFDLEQAEEQMKYIYHQVVLSKSACLGYRHFVKTVAAQKEGSVLFHCFAGKDRTGIGAMILLKLFGVDDDKIMEDYLKTNEQRRAANAKMVNKVMNGGIDEEKIQVLHTFLNVKEDYLRTAYDAINEEYGSFEGYIKNGLGIDHDVVKQLRENYLQPL